MRGSRPQDRVAAAHPARQASWTLAAPPVRIALPVAQRWMPEGCLPGLHPIPIRCADQDRPISPQ